MGESPEWITIRQYQLRTGTRGELCLFANKGESITGTGTGTQMVPNKRGISKVTGEGTIWTSAPRLSHLNGGRWSVEG